MIRTVLKAAALCIMLPGAPALAADWAKVADAPGESGNEVRKPRLFFLHFWAVDDAAKLANGLGDALDKTNGARS